MNVQLPTGVKVFQHRKAAGNARSQIRAAHFPIFWDPRLSVNTYGPETGGSPSPTLVVSATSGTGVIATGRIEREKGSTATQDARIANREAWRLYWLPFNFQSSGGDYAANPAPVESDLNPDDPIGRQVLESKQTLWLPTVSGVPVLEIAPYSTLSVFNGQQVEAFTVVEALFSTMGEFTEHEALIVREEATARRVLEVS